MTTAPDSPAPGPAAPHGGAPDEAMDADAFQFAAWRAMTPREKAAQLTELCRAVRRLQLAGLKLRHPEASPEQLELLAACQRLGRDVVEEIVGHPIGFDE